MNTQEIAEERHIILKNGEVCLVDIGDFEFISRFNWTTLKNKYAYGWAFGKTRLMHRVILDVKDPKIKVDHINGNGLDNRRVNLRLCNSQQNAFNVKPTGSTSKYKGVCWCKTYKKWTASIRANGKHKNLGRFLNEIEAAKAYDIAAIKYFEEFAYLNFPEQALNPKP